MITRGHWLTECGFTAIVIKVKTRGENFRWIGAIKIPNPTELYLLAEWDLEGQSICPNYSLKEKIETENKHEAFNG